MKSRIIGPLLVAAPCAALSLSLSATPAASADPGCAQAARAYATQEISLIDPLNKLEGCLKDRLGAAASTDDAKADKSAKKKGINWLSCQTIAARYADVASDVTDKQLAELHTCVKEAIKDFRN